jgi:hypothetical protein
MGKWDGREFLYARAMLAEVSEPSAQAASKRMARRSSRRHLGFSGCSQEISGYTAPGELVPLRLGRLPPLRADAPAQLADWDPVEPAGLPAVADVDPVRPIARAGALGCAGARAV